jgi:hypothetical protein
MSVRGPRKGDPQAHRALGQGPWCEPTCDGRSQPCHNQKVVAGVRLVFQISRRYDAQRIAFSLGKIVKKMRTPWNDRRKQNCMVESELVDAVQDTMVLATDP